MPLVEVLLTSFEEVLVPFFDLQENVKITNNGKIRALKIILILNFNTFNFDLQRKCCVITHTDV